MSRIAAKYSATFTKLSSQQHKAGEVTDRAYGDVSKLKVKKADNKLGFRIENERDPKKFKVHLTHATHDVHGLSHNNEESEDFRTSRLVKRCVTLAFDDVATANKAFNEVLEIDTNALKQLMESETLQDLIKEKMNLHEVPMKSMKPMPQWAVALSVPS